VLHGYPNGYVYSNLRKTKSANLRKLIGENSSSYGKMAYTGFYYISKKFKAIDLMKKMHIVSEPKVKPKFFFRL
jgi:hypothetical protein